VTEPVLPTADQDIERFLALRDHIEAQNKAFTEWAKPLRDEMEQITSRMHARLLELGGDKPSIKTAAGTAFTTTTKNPRVLDRDEYLKWCLANWQTYGNAMLQISSPQVAAVNEFMDAHEGALPPNVKIEPFTKVSIRKS
jgi:hypothetical protein